MPGSNPHRACRRSDSRRCRTRRLPLRSEKNVEQARAAYGQFMDFLTQAMNAWQQSPPGMQTVGFKAVQDKAIAFEIGKERGASARRLRAVHGLSDASHECLAAIPTGHADGRIQGGAGQGDCL